MCFHRYEIDEQGRIARCQIVPPTSQNQAAIEADLVNAADDALRLPDPEATHRLEQMIRSYDPCISCATHFLDLSIEYDGEGSPVTTTGRPPGEHRSAQHEGDPLRPAANEVSR